MNQTTWLLLACLATGCAARQQQDTMMMGPEDDASLTAFARELLDHVGKGDFAFMKQSMCGRAVVFDTDENGTPIAKYGKAEIDPMIDHYQALMSQPGTTTSIAIQRLDCIAHHNLCTLELDQSFGMGGKTTTYKLRATLTAKRHGDKWIWTHWHASPREAAQLPAAAEPPAPEGPVPAASNIAPPAPPVPGAK